jgi:hypothetical protein
VSELKLWIDDVRPAPEGYCWVWTVKDAIDAIETSEAFCKNGTNVYWDGENDHALPIELIDIDHDAGEFVEHGGDYINLLNWLEETGRNYPIRIHSMNPVGVANMRRIIQRNGWREVF